MFAVAPPTGSVDRNAPEGITETLDTGRSPHGERG